MNNFIKRTIFGALFVIVLLSGIVIHPLAFWFVFTGITLLGTYEFFQLIQKNSCQPQIALGMLSATLLFAACFTYAHWGITSVFSLFVLSTVFIPIAEMYRKKENPFGNIAYTFMGLLYVALPFSLLNFLVFPFGDQNYHWEILMGIFILIWANDTGAYLVGSTIGKHRLFERISPKKSWEGSIGGGVITLGIAYLCSLYPTELNTLQWIVAGLLVVVFGSLGDLVESLLKRSINIKDSGNIIPGHGGILDRFDAILLVAPVIFVFLQIISEFFR